jgi:predicted Rossmann-fold nucleotide-binding protein
VSERNFGSVHLGFDIEIQNPCMKRICVFCGSSPGSRPEYRAAAEEMATEWCEERLDWFMVAGMWV